MIQIRNVPDEIHRRAKARAAIERMSLSDFAMRALTRELARPTAAELAERIRSLEPVECAPSAAELVRAERDAR